ncbi:uncharacterized protein LOC117647679 isoform X2 [Thrips palmi]|uniref:Uncharacterized protein LOC117647679 isoform X2 n=1 Tax=Thrips palmi TaxID=161013 RepID=A0A6P8ZQ94_THRPL|nr:uncharacterized protein LOC117647679 isoform X2 [Thrips palmi]
MQGRGGQGREDDEERRRQQGGGAPGSGASDYLAAGAAAATAVGVLYGAYKIYGALRGEPAQEHHQHQPSRTEMTAYRQAQMGPEVSSYNWFTGWFNPNTLSSFWQKVKEQQVEERLATEKVVFGESVLRPEALKHGYNTFDPWFRNLLSHVLRIDNGERQEFVKAFDEIIDVLLKEMGEADPLFKYLYRQIAPAGSSWEDLKICSPDEFDLNLILFPLDIQENVTVEDVGSGHVAIRLDYGFDVPENKVLKKFGCHSEKFPSHYESIKAQLRNWVEESYVSRSNVMNWLKRVVDLALLRLQRHQWNFIRHMSRSTSGPAVTINATMKNGKTFSIDLVPALELSQKHLPNRTSAKLKAKSISRTWYAIPKGPSEKSHQKMWRTSLYEAERDFMNGQYHVKPCIRIMKRLRDVQEWKVLSSYYLKTKFMWMMEEQELRKMGLGRIIMLALQSLEDAMEKNQINYYWDDKLNLLENRGNKDFFNNARNRLRGIIKEFERSVHDDTVNPMRLFGCDKDGNLLTFQKKPSLAERSPSSSNAEANCAVM